MSNDSALRYERINYTVTETGKAIRKALREAFPGVKFSLRGSRGTGYGWFSLSWTDGPTTRQADAITNGFRSSYFDGMTDSTHQIPATMYADPDGVIREHDYSCHGVNTSRDYSPEATAWATSYVDAHGGPAIFCPDYGRENYYLSVHRVLGGIDLCGVDLAALPAVTPGYSGRRVASSYCVETYVPTYSDGYTPTHRVEVSA